MKNLLSLFAGAFIIFACSSDDNTNVQPTENPSLKVVTSVTITEDINNLLGVNDLLTYNISVKNIGNVALSGININTNLSDLLGTSLSLSSGPNFMSSDSGSAEGDLQVDETASYSATYIITQSEVDARGLFFSATANGISPEGENVSDLSDDGDDTDGNTSNDPTETIIEFDPLIISEFHMVNNEDVPQLKFYFDTEGQLYKIYQFDYRITPNEVRLYNLEFDSEQKLTNITKTTSDDIIIESIDITYDSENRVTRIGDKDFEFVEDDTSYYFLTESFSEDTYILGDYEYVEGYFEQYMVSPSNTINTKCYRFYGSEYNTVTDELDEYSYCSDFISNDYISNINNECTDADCATFSHDSNINSLYSNSTNLIEVYGFLRDLLGGVSNYDPFFILFSQNNLTLIDFSDPSSIVYEYEFNDNNLPVSSTLQWLDELGPGAINPNSYYYYQGDEIPE
ncbi:hypothetical protein ACFS5M_00105 [Lacinutrix iliipiscaria]|uniref:DUF7507 domain-containing protein n=1 Tax=Lacinutrix iliipiscaria TaxID=1230532 RepID=A0ABW5WII9_9FLAO